MVEADFCQFYCGADLRDLWRKRSGMTYRWVISHIRQLPEESRWVKHHRREDDLIWDQADYHRQDMIDLLQLAVYYLSAEVGKGLKESQVAKLHRSAPKRTLRPGERKEKPQMTPKEDLKKFFSRPH